MDMQQALRSRLLAGAPLVSLVENRVDWGARPQGKSLPAITLQIVSAPSDYQYEGRSPLQSALVQIDIWALDYEAPAAIFRAALPLIEPAWIGDDIRFEQSFVSDRRDSIETVTLANQASQIVFRTSVDLRVWSAPIP